MLGSWLDTNPQNDTNMVLQYCYLLNYYYIVIYVKTGEVVDLGSAPDPWFCWVWFQVVAMTRHLDILACATQPPGRDQSATTKICQSRLIAYGSGSSVVIQDVRIRSPLVG